MDHAFNPLGVYLCDEGKNWSQGTGIELAAGTSEEGTYRRGLSVISGWKENAISITTVCIRRARPLCRIHRFSKPELHEPISKSSIKMFPPLTFIVCGCEQLLSDGQRSGDTYYSVLTAPGESPRFLSIWDAALNGCPEGTHVNDATDLYQAVELPASRQRSPHRCPSGLFR